MVGELTGRSLAAGRDAQAPPWRRICHFGEQVLELLQLVRAHPAGEFLEQYRTGRARRTDRLLSRLRMAAHQRLDDELPVDGAGNRLAHPHILEQRVEEVEAEVLNLRAARILNLQIGARGQNRQRIHGQGIDGHVGRALLQLQRFRDRVRHDGEAHPLDLGHNRPTLGIALDKHILIDLLANEAEGPGTYRMLPEVAPAALGNNADGGKGPCNL